MCSRFYKWLLLTTAVIWVSSNFYLSTVAAQESLPNPTPPIIVLTSTVTPTVAPDQITSTPTVNETPYMESYPPDRFEPNNRMEEAAMLGFTFEPDLTLGTSDSDYFTGYVKAGQIIRLHTYVDGRLDTKITLYWQGQIVAENDDRTAIDLGSTVVFSAIEDGWYIAHIASVGAFDGFYDLEITLMEPTVTPTFVPTATPLPSATPIPTATPLVAADIGEPNNTSDAAYPIAPGVQGSYVVGGNDPVDHYRFIAKAGNAYSCETNSSTVDTLLEVWHTSGEVITINDDRSVERVDSYVEWHASVETAITIKVTARGNTFGSYSLLCMAFTPPPMPFAAVPTTHVYDNSEPINSSPTITPTNAVALTLKPLGQVNEGESETATTSIRLLVYYDANNDRQPSPSEGVANVSVVAVDAQGQKITQVFTNRQGESILIINTPDIDRIVVPFVSSWYSRINPGEVNEIVLGLPAVRIPIFIPVVSPLTGESEVN